MAMNTDSQIEHINTTNTPQTPTLAEQSTISSDSILEVYQKTDVGQQREQNEDSIFVFNTSLTSQSRGNLVTILIVADGMGGFQHGEVASQLAARTAAQYLIAKICLPGLIDNKPGDIPYLLTSAIETANLAVMEQAPNAGTTLSVCVIINQQAYLAHVGDSRIYLFSRGVLKQITHDHSLVAKSLELGHISESEALSHPQKNILYRALGQNEELEVDFDAFNLELGDQLLLCSDGLWGLVADNQILEILTESSSSDYTVNQLVNTANQNGGEDNISVILAHLKS